MAEDRTPPQASFIERLIGALRLDREVYAVASRDPATTRHAFLIVIAYGISNGLGLARHLGSRGLSAGIWSAILGWLLWTAVVFVIAGVLRHRRQGSLLRGLGFANAPGVLLIVGVVPVIGPWLRAIIVVWLVAATAIAVEAVYEVPRRRAIVIAVVSFLVYMTLGAVSGYLSAA